MPTPRRLAALSLADANGAPIWPAFATLALVAGNLVLTAAVASSAAIVLPGAGAPPAAGNVFLVSTAGPIGLIFGLVGVGAAALDATTIQLPAAGVYLVDAGLTATHFRHIRGGAADAIFQISPVPTQG